MNPVHQRLAVGTACGLAVVLCLPALFLRVSAEQKPGTVEVAVVDSAIEDVPRGVRRAQQDSDSARLDRLRHSGIDAVVLGMESVKGLVDRGDVTVVDEGAAPPGSLPPELAATDGSATVLACRPGDPGGQCARIAVAARARYGPDRVTMATATATSAPRAVGMPYVRVDRAPHLDAMAVGYDRTRLRELMASRMNVVLALPARLPSGRRWLEAEVNRATVMTGARTVLALGPLPFLSRTGDRAAFADFLAAHDLDLSLPDLTSVAGAEAYGRQLPGQVVRSHLMNVGPDSDRPALVVRSHRAEKERGVRLVVLGAQSSTQRVSATVAALTGLAPALTAELPGALHVGPPSALPAVNPGALADGGTVLAALLVVGSAGGFVAELRLRRRAGRSSPGRWRAIVRTAVEVVVSRRAVVVGGAAVAIVGAGALATGSLLLWQALALAVAIAGASVAVLVAGDAAPSAGVAPASDGAAVRTVWPGQVGQVVASYAHGVGIATATGLVVAALGSRSEFLVGLVPFAGVKLLLLAPPVVVALALGAAGPSLRREAVALWRSRSRRPLYVLSAVLLLAGATYYILRSGNSGAAPGFELRIRDALDEVMYVRPRFKEALLGFPALVMAVAWRESAPALARLAVVAAVGTASLVDTFAHFHTPVFVALLRSGYAMAIGLVVGLLVLLIVVRVRRAGTTPERPSAPWAVPRHGVKIP